MRGVAICALLLLLLLGLLVVRAGSSLQGEDDPSGALHDCQGLCNLLLQHTGAQAKEAVGTVPQLQPLLLVTATGLLQARSVCVAGQAGKLAHPRGARRLLAWVCASQPRAAQRGRHAGARASSCC